jgi:predicted nucleic acid-binding protein
VGWIDALSGSTVGLDTGPPIYYIEEHRAFLAKIKSFFEAAERNEFRIVTSFVTLVEVLVHPLREGRPELAEEYRNILLAVARPDRDSVGRGHCRGSCGIARAS